MTTNILAYKIEQQLMFVYNGSVQIFFLYAYCLLIIGRQIDLRCLILINIIFNISQVQNKIPKHQKQMTKIQ